MVGVLSFENDKLIRAARFWEIEDSSFSLAHTLSLMLDRLREEGFSNCTIGTQKKPAPGVEREVLGIVCGQKGIIVQADRYKDAQGVQVMEDLELP